MKKIFLPVSILFSQLNLTAQTFTNDVELIVPDDGTVMFSDMQVSGLPSVIDSDFGLVQVCINLDHTWDSDMDVKLKSPDGSIFTLFSGIGGDGDGFFDCCMRDDAEDFIYNYGAPFNGTFIPMGNMGIINNGQNPNGEWSLVLYDTYAWADQGFLHDWSITFGDNPPAPYPFESTNLPIVKIFTGGNFIPDEPKVEASMQIINHGYNEINDYNDTDYEYEGDILVELQGFTGPWYPKKNYDFDLIDENDMEIDTSLLGMPAENDWILKAEYLDPTLMYNNIAYSFSRIMGQYAPRTIYCELFLDGEYQGVFSMTEKIKRSEERVDIAKLTPEDLSGDSLTGGYIIEMNHNGDPGAWDSEYPAINYDTNGLPVQFKNVYPRASLIMPEQLDYIHAYVDSFEYSLHQWNFADPEDGYRKWIDVETFIDFMLVNEMSTNYDSYGRSTFLYKEKITDGGKLKIGPPWDYDRGFCCVENWVWEETHPGWPFPDWWSIFDQDELYTNMVWCRWNELRADLWSNESFHAHIDSLTEYIQDAAVRNYERWPELGVTNWNQNVIDLKNRLDDRLAWMDANINGTGPCVPSIDNDSPNLENFESNFFPPNCWSVVDADGDGQNWNGNQPVLGFESEHCSFSHSYMTPGPDNYLITPQLNPQNDEHLSWYVAGTDGNANENYEVLLSSTGTELSDFNVLLWEENIEDAWWRYRVVDLSVWEGQDIYIAFRHFDSSGNVMLKLDDIQYPTWTNEGLNCINRIDELSNAEFTVFPNPFTNQIVIRTNGREEIASIRLFDVIGNLVECDHNTNQVNSEIILKTSQLSTGVYFLEITDQDGEKQNTRIIRQ